MAFTSLMAWIKKAIIPGFTLIECSVVVAILSVIALLAISKTSGTVERARMTAAWSDLKCMREAFLAENGGYLRDMRGIPGFSVGTIRVANLFISTNLYGAVVRDGYRSLACRVDDPDDPVDGCASPLTFTRWDPEAERGWRGPYITHLTGVFPARTARRFADDATAEERGFFPGLTGLREPDDFLKHKDGCSIYGFPGEPALMDPWGNPYVLQIPPPQAFWEKYDSNTNLPDEVRFAYARVVSAGPDGRLATPCFEVNGTNDWSVTVWDSETCRSARQAGRVDGDASARGDDLVLFLLREDVDEGVEE